MRVDLHVELRVIKNGRPADSAPCFARLAGFSFNWRDPSRKMSKVVAPRDTKPDFRSELTKSNSLPTRSSKRKNRSTFFIKPDRRRISLDSRSG